MFAAIAGILIVIGLPVTILVLQQQQQTQQSAQTYGSKHDTCNKLTISLNENPVCPRLTQLNNNTCSVINPNTKNHLNSYTFTIGITSNDGKAHTFKYTSYNNFCTKGYATAGNGVCQCSDNALTQTATVGTPQNIILTRSPTTGSYCGTYQMDIHITSIDGNTNCTYTGANIGGSGLCETGTTCSGATPTPTKKPTPTPSKQVTPTPTVKLTPTPTLPPGITPTACITPGPVQNVKVTCANCSSPTQ